MNKFDLIKSNLDQQLTTAPSNVGIMFGTELYDEFLRQGLFELKKFELLGFSEELPTYKNSHFVFPSWAIADWDFKLGKSSYHFKRQLF